MRKIGSLILLIAVFMSMACGSSSNNASGPTPGQTLYNLGRQKEQTGAYLSAYRIYSEAQPVLRTEGNTDLGRECRNGMKRTAAVISNFTATERDIRNTLGQFTGLDEDKIKYLISRVTYLDMEGARYYYYDYIDTIIHLDLSLMQQSPEAMAGNRKGYNALVPFVNQPGPTSGNPYRNPINYQAESSYNIPVSELPGTGVLKIWQPLAINTDCQTNAALVSVTPASYVRNQSNLNGNLGNIYLEVPLDGLTGSLRIDVKFKFKHFEQRFTMINPDNIGPYDRESALYKEFTASKGNIFISPEIAAKAAEVVGSEQNPYKAARKLYDYVVTNTTYSHVPHSAIVFLNIPESVYVHTHRFGDCGSQSMYFAALCRAVGIPARAVGGYQMFPGMEGTHFWAEFYLPNYGWVPADTSVAQVCLYLPELTDAQQKAWKDYYFGSMDPYRMVIQKDADYAFDPPAPELTLMSTVLQNPAVLCDTYNGIPEDRVWEHYLISFAAAP